MLEPILKMDRDKVLKGFVSILSWRDRVELIGFQSAIEDTSRFIDDGHVAHIQDEVLPQITYAYAQYQKSRPRNGWS
jgi:hypothetical protein